jgi:hypothetical protein
MTKAREERNLERKRSEALGALEGKEIYFQTASEYGEPGYSTDHNLIVLANWNEVPKGLVDFVESVAEIEWSDEWVIDSDGRAFRSSPDSHGWSPAWFDHDGEIVPWDSLPEDKGDLLESLRDFGFIHDREDGGPFHSIPKDFISRERLGTFASVVTENLENGWHPGQTDTPEKALEAMTADGEYFFLITSKGQFDLSLELWRVNDVEAVASFDRFEIEMPWKAAKDMSQPGPADAYVSHWSKIIPRPDACTAEVLASELKEYGAWDDDELSDDAENWERIIWIAANNISEK